MKISLQTSRNSLMLLYSYLQFSFLFSYIFLVTSFAVYGVHALLRMRFVLTRDKKRQSQSEMWALALTDHSVKENHVINWESARIVEKERDNLARGIKQAIYIRKLPNLNRDEGRYHLSHLYITSLVHPHAPRKGGRAKTTEVGTVLSPPCSNPSAAVLCHNKPPKKSPGW